VETELTNQPEMDQLESSLEKLWEKARRLSDILLRIRGENETLRRRIDEMEVKEKQLTTDLQQKEQECLKLQSNGTGMFTHEEKEALADRIRELIGKINSRL
jgi:FtsZ-binding cell division protein ZapB